MIKTAHMLKRLESLSGYTDDPTFVSLFQEIRAELVDDIRATAAKTAGYAKAFSAAKKILKPVKTLNVSKKYLSAHLVGGVQYFCNGVMLVGLNDGNHLPFDHYKPEPGEPIVDFGEVLFNAAANADSIEFDIVDVLTQIKEWNAKGVKKLVYCFDKGNFPVVVTDYLQYAAEALGGDVQCFVSRYNKPVYMTSKTGRAAVFPYCYPKKGPSMLERGVHSLAEYDRNGRE
ncbi:hypothetical protein FACS1894208_00950 [Clostridia bacterium]|nr:hypothetical protein FACS1894208_00950 [Clostridia bacterium]